MKQSLLAYGIPNKIANDIKTQMPWYDPLMELPNILTLLL